MSDYLVRGTLAELDPEVYELTRIESERQARKLILIPSESQAPPTHHKRRYWRARPRAPAR